MDVQDYMNSVDEPMKSIVKRLRQIIKATSTELQEQIKWNVPTYSINRNICSIMAHKAHVNLQLFNGAKIQGARNLQGTGRSMRHLKFKSLYEVNEPQISNYLQQAIELDN